MNPIRARLRKHAAGGYGKIDDYEADLHKIYLHARMRIEDQLERFMADRRSSFTGPRLVKLMEEIQEVFPEFEEQYRETYEHALSYMAKKNYQQVLYDMGLDEPVYGKLDKSLYENMRDDAFTHIAGATRNMEKEIVSNLRKMSAQVMREAALTGETRAAVSRRLAFANQYGSGSIFQRPGNKATFVFRDAANREWKTDTYFKMLGRTLLHNNSRETYIAACAKEGNDIVTVSISGNPCEHCRQWENRLLSISGKTEGLDTLQSAMNSGLFHPNCTHRIIAVPESVARKYYDASGKEIPETKATVQTGNKESHREHVRKRKEQHERAKANRLDREAKLLGARKIEGRHTWQDDLKNTNPNYMPRVAPYSKNCQRAVTAYEARRRGLDVTAKPWLVDDRLSEINGWSRPYQNCKTIDCSASSGIESMRKICKEMAEMPDGARCAVQVTYDNNNGHVFIAEQKNGKAVFIDPQTNRKDASDIFSRATGQYVSIMRLDNRKFNDMVKECCDTGGGK